MRSWLLVSTLAALCLPLAAQPRLPAPKTEFLWPAGAPVALGNDDADKPSLTIYLPDSSQVSGSGVVVCPGGGYGMLAIDHEGKQVAQWLTARGGPGSSLRIAWARGITLPTNSATRSGA